MNKLIAKIIGFKDYFFTGVWREVRNTMKVRIIKTLSLSVQAFMDRSLQTQSMSLTYSAGARAYFRHSARLRFPESH